MSARTGRMDRSHPTGAIEPDWPAPRNVGALFTTRRGGFSDGRWSAPRGEGGLNLGVNCGDDPQNVARNRDLLSRRIGMPISWLAQVHGARVLEIGAASSRPETAVAAAPEEADAQVTTQRQIALGVLVADCLPVLLADIRGGVVGVAHAGWRGLAAGVLENTVGSMRALKPDAELVAWLGPCIGPAAFEVGEDVRQAFAPDGTGARAHFRAGPKPGKWWSDLAALAGDRLRRAGVSSVTSLGACTVGDGDRFWSYRRDGVCGRMAGLIWLQD